MPIYNFTSHEELIQAIKRADEYKLLSEEDIAGLQAYYSRKPIDNLMQDLPVLTSYLITRQRLQPKMRLPLTISKPKLNPIKNTASKPVTLSVIHLANSHAGEGDTDLNKFLVRRSQLNLARFLRKEFNKSSTGAGVFLEGEYEDIFALPASESREMKAAIRFLFGKSFPDDLKEDALSYEQQHALWYYGATKLLFVQDRIKAIYCLENYRLFSQVTSAISAAASVPIAEGGLAAYSRSLHINRQLFALHKVVRIALEKDLNRAYVAYGFLHDLRPTFALLKPYISFPLRIIYKRVETLSYEDYQSNFKSEQYSDINLALQKQIEDAVNSTKNYEEYYYGGAGPDDFLTKGKNKGIEDILALDDAISSPSAISPKAANEMITSSSNRQSMIWMGSLSIIALLALAYVIYSKFASSRNRPALVFAKPTTNKARGRVVSAQSNKEGSRIKHE